MMPYRVILICLLMGVYLLTANDRVQSADGYAILATAQTGNINIMGAVDYLLVPQGRMGTFGLDGNLYSKKGITPSLALAPLVWLNDLLPNAPLQATAHLFNGLVSVATALILFSVVIRLGYEKRVAFIVALMFGLGTLYLVYARTLFGEPLAGLLIILCVWLMIPYQMFGLFTSPLNPLYVGTRLIADGKNAVPTTAPKRGFLPLLQRGEWGRGDEVKRIFTPTSHYCVHNTDGKNAVPTRRLSFQFLALGILLGLLAGINLTYVVFAPIFALYVFAQHPHKIKNLILISIGFIFTVLILVGLLNLSRYGSFTETGYKFGAGEGFTTPLFTGLYGLFLSPWRGMVWYVPLFWLVPIALWTFFRTHRALMLLIVISIIIQAVIYAMWWSWHGGVVWGARFLVPIIPLVMLAFAPLVEKIFTSPHADMMYHAPITRKMRVAGGLVLFILFILSVAMQLLGTAYDFNPHEGVLYAVHEEKLANALMFHPELSAINANLNLLINGEPLNWWWVKYGDIWGFLSAIIILGCGILMIFIRHRLMQTFALILVCAGMVIFAMRGESVADRQKRDELQTALNPPAPIIATTDDTRFINLFRFRDISTVFAPTPPDEPFSRQLWQNAINKAGLRWFVTWFNPANSDNWAEKELFTHHAFVKEIWAGGYRGLLFYVHPPAPNWTASTWHFGDVVMLNQYAIETNEQGIFLMLDWGLSAPLPADWGWFVHVLDANGQIITQQDRIPLGGYMPNESSVIERLYFIAPPQNAVAIRIGWVQNGALIPVDGADEGFIVLPILP